MKNRYCNKNFGEQLLLSATVLASSISKNLDLDDVELLGAFFSTLGDSLSLIYIHRSTYEQSCTNNIVNNTDNNTNA